MVIQYVMVKPGDKTKRNPNSTSSNDEERHSTCHTVWLSPVFHILPLWPNYYSYVFIFTFTQ